MSSMRSSRAPVATDRSSRDGGAKNFYGTQAAPPRKANGTFSLIKKKKQTSLESDVRPACKALDAYKESADRLHSSLMWTMVQNKTSVEALSCAKPPSKMPVDPAYQYLSDYLVTFANTQKASTKVTFESLDPAVTALKKMHEELEKYMKKQLDTLKPLNKFIGEEYWEYAKHRSVYQSALEKMEAIKQGKQGSAEPEQSLQMAQKGKESAKTKMMAALNKIMTNREQHAQCVIKFSKVASEYHKNCAAIMATFDTKEREEDKQSAEKSCNQ